MYTPLAIGHQYAEVSRNSMSQSRIQMRILTSSLTDLKKMRRKMRTNTRLVVPLESDDH